MKERVFHFFGNLFEQSPIPTPIKLAIAFRLDFFLYFLSHILFVYKRTPGEFRIAENFMKYVYKNSESVQIKMSLLEKGLDRESQEIIERMIARQKYVFTHSFCDQRLLTKEEKSQQYISFYDTKIKYPGFGNYYGIENFYFHCGLKIVPKSILKKYIGKDVIDAGAANGDTPLIFSREYEFGKIYAFEPEAANFRKMLKNIQNFNVSNIAPVNMGIGNKKIEVRITSLEGQSYISEEGNQTIKLETIDSFVKKNNLNIGLIKMDIEGYEYNAVQGALRTIKKQHPILLISIYHCGKDFFEIKPLLDKIGGYKFMIRKFNPHHFFFDTMLIGIPK